ncbi:hypothetical protein MIAR_11030 [Microbacterium arabinogalactanolyticum]|nr:hypothetical protein MIAR_11030 [Microbacterium arabinogalactanolyticum]
MSRDYGEARRSAEVGHRAAGGVGQPAIIPGLYGLRLGRWIAWDPDPAVRLARVDAAFGVA